MNGKHTKEPPTLKSVLANKVLRPAATFVLLPLAFFILLGAMPAEADLNPWIAVTQYDPRKWDTDGPNTATPWLHPPTWAPDQGWVVLSGHGRTADALTGSWGGHRR